MRFDIWKYYSKKQIKNIFQILSQKLFVNNSLFFHYTQMELREYLDNPQLDKKQRFENFYILWHNFQNKKRILDKFFKTNKVIYPNIFKQKQRHIVKRFLLDYSDILDQINNYKAIKKEPPYSYIILIKKLVKLILNQQVFFNKKIDITDIDVQNNTIQLYQIKTNKNYKYKLSKFIQKYQALFPNKYKSCYAYMVVSSNWKDLLLQSTFKQWTSCVNLIHNLGDYYINYSSTNGVKAGNLIAYCILDLNDGKTIDQIMDDNGYEGMMYQRCFWRCSIKRYVQTDNYNSYLFCPQNTSYGTILQNAITYHDKLFVILNKWIYQLNQDIFKENKFTNQTYKTYKLPYNIYSDLHSYNNQTSDCKIYYFNIDLMKKNINQMSLKELKKVKRLIYKNKFLFTNDIVALLNMFKHFEYNQQAQKYLQKKEASKQNYVMSQYFSGNSHFFIKNTREAQVIINKFITSNKGILL